MSQVSDDVLEMPVGLRSRDADIHDSPDETLMSQDPIEMHRSDNLALGDVDLAIAIDSPRDTQATNGQSNGSQSESSEDESNQREADDSHSYEAMSQQLDADISKPSDRSELQTAVDPENHNHETSSHSPADESNESSNTETTRFLPLSAEMSTESGDDAADLRSHRSPSGNLSASRLEQSESPRRNSQDQSTPRPEPQSPVQCELVSVTVMESQSAVMWDSEHERGPPADSSSQATPLGDTPHLQPELSGQPKVPQPERGSSIPSVSNSEDEAFLSATEGDAPPSPKKSSKPRLFFDDEAGEGLIFAVDKDIDARKSLVRQIQAHGGVITDRPREATLVLVDDKTSLLATQNPAVALFSRSLVKRCVGEGKLLDFEQFLIRGGRYRGRVYRDGSEMRETSVPAHAAGPTRTRQPYSGEEQAILLKVWSFANARGVSRFKVAKIVAELMGHGWISVRDKLRSLLALPDSTQLRIVQAHDCDVSSYVKEIEATVPNKTTSWKYEDALDAVYLVKPQFRQDPSVGQILASMFPELRPQLARITLGESLSNGRVPSERVKQILLHRLRGLDALIIPDFEADREETRAAVSVDEPHFPKEPSIPPPAPEALTSNPQGRPVLQKRSTIFGPELQQLQKASQSSRFQPVKRKAVTSLDFSSDDDSMFVDDFARLHKHSRTQPLSPAQYDHPEENAGPEPASPVSPPEASLVEPASESTIGEPTGTPKQVQHSEPERTSSSSPEAHEPFTSPLKNIDVASTSTPFVDRSVLSMVVEDSVEYGKDGASLLHLGISGYMESSDREDLSVIEDSVDQDTILGEETQLASQLSVRAHPPVPAIPESQIDGHYEESQVGTMRVRDSQAEDLIVADSQTDTAGPETMPGILPAPSNEPAMDSAGSVPDSVESGTTDDSLKDVVNTWKSDFPTASDETILLAYNAAGRDHDLTARAITALLESGDLPSIPGIWSQYEDDLVSAAVGRLLTNETEQNIDPETINMYRELAGVTEVGRILDKHGYSHFRRRVCHYLGIPS